MTVRVSKALVLLVALLGCSADRSAAGGPDAAGTDQPDPESRPDAGPQPSAVDCSDLDVVIELPGQVLANAGVGGGTRLPLVLAHGMGGFDQLGPLAYFGQAPAALRARGVAVYVTAVEPMAPSEGGRGPALGRQIECIARAAGVSQVNLIGHSQGGIDARWVAAQPAYGVLIASVTTIATPHRGVPMADVFIGAAPGSTDALLDAIADFYGGVTGAPEDDADLRAAMAQLSTATMADFNTRFPDDPRLAYFSWAGRSVRSVLRTDRAEAACAGAVLPNPEGRDVIDPLLLIPFDLTSLQAPNDGLVTVDGARWGTFMGCIAADHLDQVGLLFDDGRDLLSGFDHAEFFTTLADELAARGL